MPDAEAMPEVVIVLTALTAYDELGTVRSGEAA
jgi:hypothetical protein